MTFKHKFNQVSELGSKTVGEVAFIDDNDREIQYLITKKKNYQHKPEYKSVFQALLNLRKIWESNIYKYLALPKICIKTVTLE